jgi:hypothetical protein
LINQAKLLDEIRHQLPFGVARRLLAQNGYPRGRSWQDILEKLEDNDAQRAASPTGLKNHFIEALIVSEKLGSIFPVGEKGMVALHKYASALEKGLPAHPFVENFPFLAAHKVLASIPQNEAVPVHVCEVDDATVVLFCTSRLIETREEINLAALTPLLADLYSSAVGIKRDYVQCFNALVLPYAGENCIILSQNNRYVNTTSAILDIFVLRNAINSSIGSTLLQHSFNLYPAIKPLYLSDEGEVTLLSHTVANGVKTERMRAGKCVRKESFHIGGMDAVAYNSTPFHISIHWVLEGAEDEYDSKPTLTLDGTYQMTYQKQAVLSEFGLHKCAYYSDAKFVISKLLHHIPKPI